MATPTRSLRPGTFLGTITHFGHDFTVTTDGTDGLVLEKANGRGAPHRTGSLTWDTPSGTFTAEWNPDAYPRIEPGSLLEIGLVKTARLLHRRLYFGERLPDDAGIVLAADLGSELEPSTPAHDGGARP